MEIFTAALSTVGEATCDPIAGVRNKLDVYTAIWTALKNCLMGTSLVAQWLRICLPMQGTQVRALVQEDPTCRGATKPMCHNYSACYLEPASHNY